MLGWVVLVLRQGEDGDASCALARWEAGIFGLDWLDEMAAAGNATDLGGDGYPNRYLVLARDLLAAIGEALPTNESPLVIGEDYVLSAGAGSRARVDTGALAACEGDAVLVVEAWDQS